MSRVKYSVFIAFFYFFSSLFLTAQDTEKGQHPYVIRGEIVVDLEPMYIGHIDSEYPLEPAAAGKRALEEAVVLYSAMIYGWSFHYDVGERARQIEEKLELTPVSQIQYGDPRLSVTEVEISDSRLKMWTDYHLSEHHQRQLQTWRSGTIRNAQAVGYGPSAIDEYPGWLTLKMSALEDAARAALRAMLRGSERNRPKEVTGFISIAAFPRFYIEAGRWAASSRFRVQINEIVPFAAY
jgi:hypothetical protein